MRMIGNEIHCIRRFKEGHGIVISFSVPEARNQLLENGIVFTFRWTQRKKTGRNWANEKRGGKKIANVFIDEPRLIETVSDLDIYVPLSGFTTRQEWVKVIESMKNIPRDWRGFLYKVTLISQDHCVFWDGKCTYPDSLINCVPERCGYYFGDNWEYYNTYEELQSLGVTQESQQLRTKENE